MHASAFRRLTRIFTFIIPALFLAGCFGEGEGQDRTFNEPVQPEPPVPPGFCDPINFEPLCPPPTFLDFAGGFMTIVNVADLPDAVAAGNDSLAVGRMIKADPGNGETFGGVVIVVEPFDFTAGSSFTAKVYSPRPVRVLLEPKPVGEPSQGLGVEVNHGGTGWEDLTFFPLPAPSGAYEGVVLIFDNGVAGDLANNPDDWTFWVDDITLVAGEPLDPTVIPVDFENDPISYNFGPDGGFEGAISDVIDNPDPSGINATDQTARMQKFSADSGFTFGGSNLTLAENVDFSQGEAFTMKVWATRPVPVLFKFEDAISGLPENGIERSLNHSGSSSWEELCFDFSGSTAGFTTNSITFIFDIDNLGDAANDPDGWTFYYDEIEQVADCSGGPGPQPFSRITFDDPAITYALRGFNGAEDSTVVVDPTDGANNVVQVNRSATADTFAGTVVSTGPNESVGIIPLDAANTTMTVRVWSPVAGAQVRMKIENSADPAISVETEATTTVAGDWETLTFDFANQAAGTAAFDPAASYDKIVIFFNFGVDGATAGAQTFYFDDIDVGSGGSAPTFNPVTFDDPAITYALRGFNGAEDSTVVVDPTDATNNVAQVNRAADAATFAGTVVSTGPNETIDVIPLDAANTTMTVRVWSPVAGIQVRLKIENSADPAISVETEATTTVASDWETLTFDFANQAAGTAAFDPAATYDRPVIFFNFGVDGATAGAQTFYFDDIDVGSGGGGGGSASSSQDFESGPVTFLDFGGGLAAAVPNPDVSGLNNSATVGQMQKFAGEIFGGSTLDLGGSVALAAGDSYTMLVRAQRPVPVTFKLEPIGDERVADHSGSGTWELLCFDFTGVAGDITGYTIIFDNGIAGDAANDPDRWTFQFDDIQQVSECPAAPPAPSFEPITFDDPAVTYALRGFNGAEDSTVVQDPTDPANNVAQVNRAADAATFAGTVVSTGPNETIPVIPLDAANTTMNIRVWSPVAGIQVRLKIENSDNPAISVETEATTTVASDWETLTFDFANQAAGTPAFDPAATYDRPVIFFNFGVDGATAGAQTFYFDDIDVGPGSVAPVFNSVTFDDPAITYALRGFNGAEDSTVVVDPTDATNNVAQVNRAADAATFAGTVVSTGPNETIDVIPLDAANTTMNIRVWSPVAGIQVRLKIENSADPAISVETEATTTVASDWETLTFDFANQAAGTTAFDPAATYDRPVIFFNFGVDGATAGAQTFYFDDIDVGSGGGGGGGGGGSTSLVNADFEANGGSLDGWTVGLFDDVGGGLGSITADSSGQGGRAGTVARLQVAGSAASFNDAVISQEGLAQGTVVAGDTITVTFDLYGTVTQPGAATFVEVIFLDANGQDVGGRNFLNADPTPYTATTTWTNYSGTVTAGTGFVPNPAGGPWDVSGGVVLSLKVSCGPVDGCAQDVSFDNVTFTIN
jgi:uncharacterized protein involved in high-affinity Fe2+ transport